MKVNGKHRVFVYGILKTDDCHLDPPDAVRGTMFRKGIALSKFGDDYTNNIVRGQVREVDDNTLRTWDRIEGVVHHDPLRGMYRRIRIATTLGIDAWAYEYNGSVCDALIVESGVWLGHTRGNR